MSTHATDDAEGPLCSCWTNAWMASSLPWASPWTWPGLGAVNGAYCMLGAYRAVGCVGDEAGDTDAASLLLGEGSEVDALDLAGDGEGDLGRLSDALCCAVGEPAGRTRWLDMAREGAGRWCTRRWMEGGWRVDGGRWGACIRSRGRAAGLSRDNGGALDAARSDVDPVYQVQSPTMVCRYYMAT